MKPYTRESERGSAIVYSLLIIVLLMGLASSSSMLVVQNQKTSSESLSRTDAFYLADSGAQIGNFLLRANNGTMSATTQTSSIGGGSATVAIEPVDPNLYRVVSVGASSDAQETVEMYVEFTDAFDMEGAIQVSIGDSVEVATSEINMSLRASTLISGLDHDASGAILADQSEATYGVAMTPVPGAVGLDIVVETTGGADLEGSPDPTTNMAEGDGEVFNELLSYARSNADITVTGSDLWNNGDLGNFGTPGAPLLTYVHLGDNETLEMRQNFVGHGTLVIEVDRATTDPSLYMSDSVQWYGLVVIHFKGDAEIPGGQLVHLDNYAMIIGGLSINFSGDDTQTVGSGLVYKATTGNASVRYCSQLLKTAVGIPQVVDRSARVVSYRRLLP